MADWVEDTMRYLTADDRVRSTFRKLIERTIGDAADGLLFEYEKYQAPDKIGRAEKARAIGHWLCVEARLDRSLLQNAVVEKLLIEGDLDAVWSHARTRLTETGYRDRVPSAQFDESVEVSYGNGYKLVRLRTPEAFINERAGSGMEGTFGNGYDHWVLRDNDDVSLAKLVAKDGVVWGVQGRHDRAVPYHLSEAYIIPFILENGMTLTNPSCIDGAVQTADGTIYDIRDLPDGCTIDGNVRLADVSNLLSRLPEDMTVNGSFIVSGATYLKETPRNMRVTGDVYFAECPALRTIRSGMRVGRYADFVRCPNLEKIEADVEFSVLALSSDIVKLDAEPFVATSLSLAGISHLDKDTPRDRYGRVEIDGDFIQAAKKRAFRKEMASLPGLFASVAYNEMTSRIQKVFRGLTAPAKAKPENRDDDLPPRPPGM